MFTYILVLTLAQWVIAQDDCVLAKTDSGMVCGVRKKAVNGDDYVSFLGIPYAKAPIGPLRFAEPQRPDPFDGVFNATTQGPVCPHTDSEFGRPIPPSMYSEDCLRVNIHVPLSAIRNPQEPKDTCKHLLPVFAYVHGGSFAVGSGNPDTYGAEYLLSKGIILVTMNYRINSIGFLSLNSKYVPGNAGLRDVLFSLKWIRRNIRNFGGDPDEVTLGGQSAGGVITHLLSLSPATKDLGLFNRVLSLSGTAIANFYSPNPFYSKIVSELFLVGMGISSIQSPKDIHQQLIDAPIEKILEANRFVVNKTGFPASFIPVIESPQEDFTTIIPKDPGALLKEGYGKEYTIFLGVTSNECQGLRRYFENGDYLGRIRNLPVLLVPQRILFRAYVLALPSLISNVSAEYFNNTAPAMETYLGYCTDAYYISPLLKTIERRLDSGAEPTYAYHFDYHGERSLFKTVGRTDWRGAAHSEDLSYFFRINQLMGPMTSNELAQDDYDSRMKEWMTSAIANYVKTGKPTTNPADWPASGPNFDFLNIRDPAVFEFQPATPYMQDKKKFFDTLNKLARMQILG